MKSTLQLSVESNEYISIFSSEIAKQDSSFKFDLVVELIHGGGPVISGGAVC